MASSLTLELPSLQEYLRSLNYEFHERPMLNLLGIRSALPSRSGGAEIRLVPSQNDVYNDTVAVFGTDRQNRPVVRAYKATVDPGSTYTRHPQRLGNRGCAHLANGNYRYRVGYHKRGKPGGHPALVEAGPVTVWRDYDKDWRQDASEHNLPPTMACGIHIHAGGTGAAIGPWSAGCQVLWGGRLPGSPWTAFFSLVKTAVNEIYWYSLVDAGAFLSFQAHGPGPKLRPDSPELSLSTRQALQQVLTGIAVLYDYQQQAQLGTEGEASFLQLLNQLRNAGALRNVRLEDRPDSPQVESPAQARAAMLTGFRLLYGNWPRAGLDAGFLAQLNRLRHFGPLRAL